MGLIFFPDIIFFPETIAFLFLPFARYVVLSWWLKERLYLIKIMFLMNDVQKKYHHMCWKWPDMENHFPMFMKIFDAFTKNIVYFCKHISSW